MSTDMSDFIFIKCPFKLLQTLNSFFLVMSSIFISIAIESWDIINDKLTVSNSPTDFSFKSAIINILFIRFLHSSVSFNNQI